MAVVEDLQQTISGIAERAGPAVVGLGRGWGLGSGVVVESGQVLTCAHNLRRDEVSVSFSDGRVETGRVAGSDPDLDIALVSVETGSAPAIEWEPRDEPPALGSPVVALADPGGRGLRATLGLVASAGRSFRGPRGRRVANAIEHTATLPRGSSGGPLVDAEGRLLGLNALRLEGGLILALPAGPALRERAALLARGQAPVPHRLGVAVAPPRVARRLRRAVGLPERSGLLVRAVEQDSAAEQAGIEAGDLLVSAADRELESADVLYAALDEVPPAGGELQLGVVRGSDERRVSVQLGDTREAA